MKGRPTEFVDVLGRHHRAHYELVELATPRVRRDMMRSDVSPETLDRANRTDSAQFRPEYLVNTDPTPYHGPPILGIDGVVESGSRRVTMVRMLANAGRYEQYGGFMRPKLADFDIPAWAAASRRYPLVIRVRDAIPPDPEQRRRLARVFNIRQEDKDQEIAQMQSDAELLGDVLPRIPKVAGELLRDTLNRPETLRMLWESTFQNLDPVQTAGFLTLEDDKTVVSAEGARRIALAGASKLIDDPELLWRMSRGI